MCVTSLSHVENNFQYDIPRAQSLRSSYPGSVSSIHCREIIERNVKSALSFVTTANIKQPQQAAYTRKESRSNHSRDINKTVTSTEKTKVMRISRQPFPVKIMIDQKKLENVESF